MFHTAIKSRIGCHFVGRGGIGRRYTTHCEKRAVAARSSHMWEVWPKTDGRQTKNLPRVRASPTRAQQKIANQFMTSFFKKKSKLTSHFTETICDFLLVRQIGPICLTLKKVQMSAPRALCLFLCHQWGTMAPLVKHMTILFRCPKRQSTPHIVWRRFLQEKFDREKDLT
jgi:hypothetical protein